MSYLNYKALLLINEASADIGAKLGTYFGSNIGLYGGLAAGALGGLGVTDAYLDGVQNEINPEGFDQFAQENPTATRVGMDIVTVPFGAGVGAIGGELAGAGIGAGAGILLGGSADLRKKMRNIIGINSEDIKGAK